MTIEDFDGACEVSDATELENSLNRRYSQEANSFWLTHAPSKSPSLAILVKGDLASLNYFPGGNSAGFRSVGEVKGLNPEEMSTVYLDSPNQEQEVLNSSIVPFSDALKTAKEFLASKELPSTIEWFEL